MDPCSVSPKICLIHFSITYKGCTVLVSDVAVTRDVLLFRYTFDVHILFTTSVVTQQWCQACQNCTFKICTAKSLFLSLQGQKDPFLVDKIMNDLDSNKDNEVDFNEFVILVAALTVACNDFFEEQLKKEGF